LGGAEAGPAVDRDLVEAGQEYGENVRHEREARPAQF
jgi:hypothetical protein